MDPRSLENTKPHENYPAEKRDRWTPAVAAKSRKKLAKLCMCRLCALALSPPLTFAERDSLGLVDRGLTGLWEDMGW